MLIYAWNHTFCSKSENKAPRILIFGVNILYSIPNNVLEKKSGIKINFLCIVLFYEFLMYFFVFQPFVFVLFFRKIYHRTFFKHNYAKMNWFQPMKVKIIISLWIRWGKLHLHWLCTQNHVFWAIFGLTSLYKRSCSVVTVCPIFAKMVS